MMSEKSDEMAARHGMSLSCTHSNLSLECDLLSKACYIQARSSSMAAAAKLPIRWESTEWVNYSKAEMSIKDNIPSSLIHLCLFNHLALQFGHGDYWMTMVLQLLKGFNHPLIFFGTKDRQLSCTAISDKFIDKGGEKQRKVWEKIHLKTISYAYICTSISRIINYNSAWRWMQLWHVDNNERIVTDRNTGCEKHTRNSSRHLSAREVKQSLQQRKFETERAVEHGDTNSSGLVAHSWEMGCDITWRLNGQDRRDWQWNHWLRRWVRGRIGSKEMAHLINEQGQWPHWANYPWCHNRKIETNMFQVCLLDKYLIDNALWPKKRSFTVLLCFHRVSYIFQ